ncbi:MAG: LytTR family DNA-binding domain-containing protein [Steroidobacteraceae bacterium]
MRHEHARYLTVSVAGKATLIPVATVVAIHGDDDYSSIEGLDGRRHLHKKTLAALECVLPTDFRRVHRSHIVNLQYVVRLLTLDGGAREVLLANGTRVPMSRSGLKTMSKDML